MGKPDVKPDAPARTRPGSHRATRAGNYEKQGGHEPDGRSTAKRSTGVNPDAMEPIDPSMPNLSPG